MVAASCRLYGMDVSFRRQALVTALIATAALALACTGFFQGSSDAGQDRPTPVPTARRPLIKGPQVTATPKSIPATKSTPSPASTVAPPKASGGFDRVEIYLIALSDDGASGRRIGCGDSVVAVEREIEPTVGVLRAALDELFSLEEREYGQSGLINVLADSNLAVDRLALDGGRATIYLTGDILLAGVCDDPRFEAQIVETARQFSTVDEVEVFINGTSLDELLSSR